MAFQPNEHFLMKTVLGFSLALLAFLGITSAVTPDPKAPQILIQAKFVEVSERNPELSRSEPLPAPLDAAKKAPVVLTTLTDPQFQVLIRSLNQRKGVDLLSAPRITTRSGQRAEIEVIREFVYQDEAGKQDTKHPGVTLAVLPKMAAADQITLDLSPQVVEFEGFAAPKSGGEEPIFYKKILYPDGTSTEFANNVEKGEVRESKFDARGVLLSEKTVPAPKARGEPIFNERKANAKIALTSGQTVILEMEPRTDKQLVEETDEAGRVISSKTDVFRRRLFVFVTASLVDPATGKPRGPAATTATS